MGFFDFLVKTVEYLPTIVDSLDKLGVTSSSPSSSSSETDPDELIEECEEYLLKFSKFSVDEVDEALNCLSRFERRWLKLDQIDCNSDDEALSRAVSRLDSEKEKEFGKFEKRLQDFLDELSEASKAENDPAKWQELNDQWFKYMRESQKITDHKLKFLEKMGGNAFDFLNE